MAPNTKTAALELRDETPDRPFILLAGERFHYKLRSDMRLDDLVRAMELGSRFSEIGTDQAIAKFGRLRRRRLRRDLHVAVEMVMFDMPRKLIRRELTEMECVDIVAGFQHALQEPATKPAAQSRTKSRASSGSTGSRRRK